MKIELDDKLFESALSDLLTDQQIIRTAVSRALAQSSVQSTIVETFARKMTDAIQRALSDPTIEEHMISAIREAAMELGQQKLKQKIVDTAKRIR